MKPKRKRMLSLLLAVLCLLLILPGCGQENDTILIETAPPLNNSERDSAEIVVRENAFVHDNPITLRLLTTEGSDSIFGCQMEPLIQAFTAVYPNVTIEVTTLTSHNQERVLEKLETELAGGKGYDLYLLPTGGNAERNPFPDVNIAMRSEYFADLSGYYDADAELDTAGLVTEVMDAGLVGGARYTLPMGFDYPVQYVNMEQLYQTGLRESSFEYGMGNLMNEAMMQEVRISVPGAGSFFNLFPCVLDYDTQEVVLTEAELAEFLESYLQYDFFMEQTQEAYIAEIQEQGLDNIVPGEITFFPTGTHWTEAGQLSSLGRLKQCLSQAATAKAVDAELGMFPITGDGGEVVAEVTFFGAVGAACEYPGAAYEFLRLFLLPQTQWEETVLPPEDHLGWMERGLTVDGYPVRASGSVSTLYPNLYEREITMVYMEEGEELSAEGLARQETLAQVKLTEDDVPILQETVDACYYPAAKIENALYDLVVALDKNDDASYAVVEDAARQYIGILNDYLHGDMDTE